MSGVGGGPEVTATASRFTPTSGLLSASAVLLAQVVFDRLEVQLQTAAPTTPYPLDALASPPLARPHLPRKLATMPGVPKTLQNEGSETQQRRCLFVHKLVFRIQCFSEHFPDARFGAKPV
jgi:hypothetical protein